MGQPGMASLDENQAMIRVLFVIHFPVFGGPHNQAIELNTELEKRGFQTIVVLPDEPGNARSRLELAGLAVRTIPLHRLRSSFDPRTAARTLLQAPSEVRALRRIIRTERISVVQVGGLVNPHAAIAARLESVPVVWQLLDTRAPWIIAAAAMIWVDQLADVVMSTGVRVAEAHPGFSRIRERVLPFFPPVDLVRFAPRPGDRRAIRSEWGASPEDVVVGCVSNINPQKGIVELVQAFSDVKAVAARAKLVLVGAEYATHASYSWAVRETMRQYELIEGRDVLLIGECGDPERQLAGMDIFALAAAARSEGITTAVLEAMASGLPVVVTDVGGLREAVVHERTGFVLGAGDRTGFSEALTKLVREVSLRELMGRNARRIAEEILGVDRTADVHAEAYSRALRKSSPRRRKIPHPPASRSPLRVVNGIEVFVTDEAIETANDHDHSADHKSAQAAHYDEADEAEFEIVRPRGAGRLYDFLLSEKFRLAVEPIRHDLAGASALVVCGGSGMDAEYFSSSGATVITSDLSLGAAVRAKARSDRFSLGLRSIVADVEHLPFADRSVDLVAVHDGLHHLEEPGIGLAEMSRVAKRWVIVTEPAQALFTRLAIRLGLALEREPAGNIVIRFSPMDVAAQLEAQGFKVLRAQRYLMYYPHRPGRVFRLLSRPLIYPVACAVWRIANFALRRGGNKLVVVAERNGR